MDSEDNILAISSIVFVFLVGCGCTLASRFYMFQTEEPLLEISDNIV
jgi:hypothetical protein